MEMQQSKNSLKSFTAVSSQALEASYLVSLQIAQTGKRHTIGKNLILPAAKDIVACQLGPQKSLMWSHCQITLSHDAFKI